ncbi:uncharacterized protein BT62DRAFT_1010364 [Guyanagaster necrorhizus]|uniref:Uncharacterized protein n=1 Tax=Guyanagaster necrorhizus TaxID=856835 RepID=A0A9P7VKV9_9AGAR|nr:uncharacterized protein BT62DRAFT_1010364 [Guyanagaster necrorhizus MCA 3950]KAG7442420.1 hypothetical protein BT62DRAFT_1010364 [Guyanagaster necrorhizus MCA 3950]
MEHDQPSRHPRHARKAPRGFGHPLNQTNQLADHGGPKYHTCPLLYSILHAKTPGELGRKTGTRRREDTEDLYLHHVLAYPHADESRIAMVRAESSPV